MKRIPFLLINLLFCLLIQAQIPKIPTNLQSPNTASLGLYGEVPVSLFTGIPGISIPLFNAPDKYNGFSIGLSYHGGGVRPDQHPGWVGTNWTLMAGGCITRVEKGGCDEMVNDYYVGYYSNNNTLNDNDLTKNNYLNYDTEPDEFTFSFGNYSGKFYFDRNKNLVVKCNKLIKATLISGSFTVPDVLKKGRPTSWVYTFKGFRIKTEDGTEYIFGGDQGKIEFNMEFWRQLTNQWYAIAWHLAQIKYPNGKTIDFNYERGPMINQMYISKSNETYNLYEKNTNGGASETLKCSGANESGTGEDKYEGYLISPIYLTSISSSDFRIEFQSGYSYELRVSNSIYLTRLNNLITSYGTAGCSSQCNFLPYLGDSNIGSTTSLIQTGLCWKVLNCITIYNNSQLIKRYNLKYDYSNITSGSDPQYYANERLFLMSVVQNDSGKYNFDYYNKQLLPPYLAQKTDHWGFYNNKPAQYSRNDYFSSREPDSTAVKYGALKTITYPTGGTSQFIFEANQYSSQTKLNRWEGLDNYSSNRIAGGLRIKKIINTPAFGETPTVKEYFYTKNYFPFQTNGVSSGILGGQIQYFFDNRAANSDRNLGFGSTVGSYLYSCFTTQSVLPVCTNSLGNHIGYSEVVEKLSDNSYTRYKFSNFDTGNLDEKCNASIETESPYQAYNSKEQERGNLLSKQMYDSNNVIKLTMLNKYQKSDLGYINSINGNSKLQQCLGELTGTYYTEATSYKIYTYSMLLGNKKEISYYNTDSLVKETKFRFDSNYPIVVNQVEKDSRGDSITTVYTYPFHINGNYLAVAPLTNVGNGSRLISEDLQYTFRGMYSANLFNLPIEISTYKNKNVIDSKFICYGKHGNDYLPDSVYILEKAKPLPAFNRYNVPTMPHYVIDGNYEKSPSYKYKYDSKSNITQMTGKDGLIISFLWGYNYQYPIAEIKNATNDQVKNALGDDPETIASSAMPDMSKINGLRTALPNALVTTYTYKPMVGMTSKTDPKGIISRYVYDSSNRLSLVRDNFMNIVGYNRYA